LLPTFHEKLSQKALAALEGIGVEVMFDCHVTGVSADHVDITADKDKSVRRIDTNTVVWAAGVKASELGKKLAARAGQGVETDRAGRVVVGPDCSVPGHPNVFVIGDMGLFKGPDGKPLPGVAPVAMQQGDYVAAVIARRVKGEPLPADFHYWDKGSMATIGRSRAVADTMGLRFNGWLAWMAWLFVHIMYLVGFENRLLVLSQWFFNYITRNRSARLITGERAAGS
jgi:NADH dehydrogenase